MKTYKKKHRLTYKDKHKQKGGDKLGQGSYGCVIKPPVKCIKYQPLRKHKFKIDNNHISKLIEIQHLESAITELNIGNKVQKLDPSGNYFATLLNACYFSPQRHNDIVYLNQSGTHVSEKPSLYSESKTTLEDSSTSSIKKPKTQKSKKIYKTIKKKYGDKCILKSGTSYINMIGKYGGEQLNSVLSLNRTNDKLEFIRHNHWFFYSYLIKGLELLHRNNIIHKDIKPSNIVISFDYLDKTDLNRINPIIGSKIKYIDFGLSSQIKKSKYTPEEMKYLLSKGTQYYIPLEIFALKAILKLVGRGYNPDDRSFLKKIMSKEGRIYQKNREYYHFEGLRHSYFKGRNEKSTSHSNTYYLNPTRFYNIFKTILDLYRNNKIDNIINDLVLGWDIYSLGITLAKMYIKSGINDSEFKKIIFKMIELDFKKRANIRDLVNHKNYYKNLDKYNFSSYLTHSSTST